MSPISIKRLIHFSFGGSVLILFLLGMIGMYQVRSSNETMAEIVQINNKKIEFANTMRNTILFRQSSLNLMLSMDDVFELEQERMNYYAHAGPYRIARDQLLQLPMNEAEKSLHKQISQITRSAQPLNNQAVDLLLISADERQIEPILKQAKAEQTELLNLLSKLIELQNLYANEAVYKGREQYDQSVMFVFYFGIVVVFAAMTVVRYISNFITTKNVELLQKNEQLAVASAKALEATRAKSAFLATMSHEIRTPLTAIIGFAEASLDKDQTMVDRVAATKTIIRSGKHLLDIINDILDLSKTEANKLEVELIQFSLFDMLHDVQTLMSERAREKQLPFKIDYQLPLPKQIVSDQLRMKQILINLCGNAIKFTEMGRVGISVWYNKDKSQVGFDVIDTGVGLSEAQCENIFEPFTQADSSTTRKYGGTGLGLSLSRELATLLEGEISAKSIEGVGSRFTFTADAGAMEHVELVHKVEHIPKPHKGVEAATETARLKGQILLAEDNVDNQHLISMLLQKIGANVTVARNGQIAIDRALNDDYDLILMDIQMPVMGGMEAIRHLREIGYTKPIVALTANAMKQDFDNCIEAGCNGFLTKPVNREHLFATTAKYLQNDESEKSNCIPITSSLLEKEPEFIDIVEKFVSDLPNKFADIKMHVANENWSELRGIVHTLKGSGGGMGYSILTNISGNIEFQIINQNYNDVKSLVNQLEEVCQRIMSGFAKHKTNQNNVAFLSSKPPN
jgi:signal transduction histidine kinase/DNA-binding response OmpR family regulator